MNNTFSDHLFEYRSVEKKKLMMSLYITSIVMFVELIGGYITHSIALISDAGHMFTHCFAIGLSLIAILIARRPPCHQKTFGLYRAEILAAFINGLFLLLVVGVILYEAALRIIHPREILGLHMLIIAFIGLAVNIASIFILHGNHKEDLNIKSVFYHMIADTASSVGIILAAIIISFTGWNTLDPIVSIGISLVILYWSWGVLKESTAILLEMPPSGVDINSISDDLKMNFPEIVEINNVHLWAITANMLVFSAHIKINTNGNSSMIQNILVKKVNKHLANQYKIAESTIQITLQDYEL
ncbi:MAG: cation transporter [Planctomycetes bacterium]|nr:cation transporter [Planctomycetota bacterium]